jgi:hypothetical protein
METSSKFPYWREPLRMPDGMSLVSLLGAPMRSQVSEGYHALYHEIGKRVGPNDGMVGVAQAAAHCGLVCLIDEMTHLAEDAKLKPALQRTLGLIAMDVLKADFARFEEVEADFSSAGEVDYWLRT